MFLLLCFNRDESSQLAPVMQCFMIILVVTSDDFWIIAYILHLYTLLQESDLLIKKYVKTSNNRQPQLQPWNGREPPPGFCLRIN